MPNSLTQKSKANIVVDIIEFDPDSVVYKTTIKKQSGTINSTTHDNDEALTEKVSPFDNFAQVVEGKAEIHFKGRNHVLESGHGIIIPAHETYSITSKVRFKMIMTTIKSDH